MNIKKVILISLTLPLLTLFVLWLFYRFYTPAELRGDYQVLTENLNSYADDGSRLPGTLYSPAASENFGVVFLLPDRNLNRDWNHDSIAFRTGRRLAHTLASHGLRVITYDQRGTGENNKPGSYPSFSDLADDFRTVFVKNSSGKGGSAPRFVAIVAQGQGCLVALRAINRYRLSPLQRLDLVGCAYSGTLLESWNNKIINNMEKMGASSEQLARVRHELDEWIRTEKYKEPLRLTAEGEPEMDGEVRDDELRGLYHTLDRLRSPELHPMTVEAASVYFADELRAVTRRKNITIYHWNGQYDAELAPGDREATLQLAGELMNRSKNYSYAELKATNHFLKIQSEAAAGGIAITINRVNPFLPLNMTVVKAIISDAVRLK